MTDHEMSLAPSDAYEPFGLEGKYDEARWTDRFEYDFILKCDFCDEESKTPHDPEAEEDPKGISNIVRVQYTANLFLTLTPTVLLVGMLGAAAFSILSLGPPWIGFLICAIPIAILGVWAFIGPVTSSAE